MIFRRLISRQDPGFGCFVAVVVIGLVAASGCASTEPEPDNLSSKPWNSPEGYQNGNLPSNMLQRR